MKIHKLLCLLLISGLLLSCGEEETETRLTQNFMEIDSQTYPLDIGYIAREHQISGEYQYRILLTSSDLKPTNADENFFEFNGSSGDYLVFTLLCATSSEIASGEYAISWGEADQGYTGSNDVSTIQLNTGEVDITNQGNNKYYMEFSFDGAKKVKGNITTVFEYFERIAKK